MSDYLEYFGVPPQSLRDVETRPEFYASAGQTVFPVTYKPGYVDVYRNGILQSSDTYTAASGVDVTLNTACTLGEHIRFTSRRQVAVNDVYTQTETSSLANNFYTIGTGTGDAATGITTPTVGFTLSDGREVRVRWPAPNTITNPTFNANGTGAKKLVVSGGHPVSIGSLSYNHELTLRYNVTKDYYEIINVSDIIFPKSAGLTQLLHPHVDGGWRDIYRAGWRPSGFNQQWGGSQWGAEMIDGATSSFYKFDVATGYIEADGTINQLSQQTGVNEQRAEGFKVSDTQTVSAIWIRGYKVGNGSYTVNLKILPDDGTGKPSGNTAITNGTATGINHKNITSNTFGEWYRFVFPTPPTLTSNTTYHVTLSSSGAIDSANYFAIITYSGGKYPHGKVSNGNSASSPVWSLTGYNMSFLVEASSSSFLQSNGQFSNKLVFSEGSPINQSKSLTQPLCNFFDGKQFTFLTRISSAQKGKPIADFRYGIDHDRIQILTDATTGFVTLNFWDKNRTLVTLVANAVDTSAAAFTDIAVGARMIGDGSDYLQLWINGALVASTSAATYVVDSLMRELGTAWIGGGFPVAPTWTQDVQMTSLPSSQGWTFTNSGSSVEANCFSIQNGKLFQNKNGYGATDNGLYSKNTSLSNATGWTVCAKLRVPTNTNTAGSSNCVVAINDGTKSISFAIAEFFVGINTNGTVYYVQGNFKNKEHVFMMHGKGSDAYFYIDGRMVFDGTGMLSSTTATNTIAFGDSNTNSGENADAIWSYVKYYQGGMLLPQASTGCALHEAAFWSGDKTAFLPALYASGSPRSVKQFCGIKKNYIEHIGFDEAIKGIATISTSSTTWTVQPGMEIFFLGSSVYGNSTQVHSAAVGGIGLAQSIFIDGNNLPVTAAVSVNAASNGSNSTLMYSDIETNVPLGLHKAEVRWNVTSSSVNSGVDRLFRIKGRS